MRRAGMLATFLVLIAVGLGIYSLSDHFGLSAGDIVSLVVPVIIGVTVLTVFLVIFGFWSVRKLNEASEANEASAQDAKPADSMANRSREI